MNYDELKKGYVVKYKFKVHNEVQDEVHTEVQELETELKEARDYIKHLEDEISILESYLAQTL